MQHCTLSLIMPVIMQLVSTDRSVEWAGDLWHSEASRAGQVVTSLASYAACLGMVCAEQAPTVPHHQEPRKHEHSHAIHIHNQNQQCVTLQTFAEPHRAPEMGQRHK